MAKGSDAHPRGAWLDEADRRPGWPAKSPTWALSPTDLTFLWDECPRCFYNKVVLKRPRPRTPFPKVFGLIDRAMKTFYLGERAEELVGGAPRGVIGQPDRWVKSRPIVLPGCSIPMIIRGRVDAVVECDDGTVGVIDFKTAEPGPAAMEKYSRQLHSYALALEHPASGSAEKVSRLGLLCFEPTAYEAKGARAGLLGRVEWIGVDRNPAPFFKFLGDVSSVLDGPEPPDPGSQCQWCALAIRESVCELLVSTN